jgi:CRP/FNR family cyclic AMP-dependent transcriptional regulator
MVACNCLTKEHAMRLSRKHQPDAKVAALRRVSLFRGCSESVLNDIAGLICESHFAAGDVLCRQGHIGRQAFVILEGQAAVEISGTQVATLGPDKVVGEMALIDQRPRSATVTALSPMTVLPLSVLEFRSLLDAGGAPVHEILVQLTARLREMERHSFDTEPLVGGPRDGAVIVKRVIDPRDARRAMDPGARGLLVSNHGGRQLDAVAATAERLPAVVDHVTGDIDVIAGGGIRRGSDISKARPVPRDQSGDVAIYITPQDATIEGPVSTSKPSEHQQPTLTEPASDHDRLRRCAIIGGLSVLLLVLSWLVVPVIGCILTILAVLVLYGLAAPEPLDTHLEGNFDRHRHARW